MAADIGKKAGDWQVQETGTGSDSFTYQLGYDTWLCICLYDADLGQWREAFYLYKQAWYQRAATGPILSNAGVSNYVEVDAPAAGDILPNAGETVFADNLKIGVYTTNSLRTLAWNFSTSQIVADDTQASPSTIEIPAASGEWLVISIYDNSLASWLDGIYVIRDRWF